MKQLLVISSFMMTVLYSQSQTLDPINRNDVFCRMIGTIYSLDKISFKSEFLIKNVFERDTVISHAEIFVQKSGTSISTLRVISVEQPKELLYHSDTAWQVRHDSMSLTCLGLTIDNALYNELAVFFPYNLFSIDTLIWHTDPIWRLARETSDEYVVSLDAENSSGDLTDLVAEFFIGKDDLMPYGTYMESTYLKADKLIQIQHFRDYNVEFNNEFLNPEYLTTYKRNLDLLDRERYLYEENEQDSVTGENFLMMEDLVDIDGNSIILPESGLIFLDFWYVGCPPCMKSATVVEKIYQDYKHQVHFYSINETDTDTAKIKRFVTSMGISFPVLLNRKGKMAFQATGTGGYPVFLLVDGRTRQILWKRTGYSEDLGSVIIDAIKAHE